MAMQMEEARSYVMQALVGGRCGQIEDIMMTVGSLRSKSLPHEQRQATVIGYGVMVEAFYSRAIGW